MFILENPYVSKLMLETMEKNRFEVLDNSVARKFDYNLNLVKGSCDKIYSNSENSIDWVLKNFPNSDITRLINICKNKYEFRKALKDVFPKFFFDEITDLENADISNFPEEFIIKPSVGFLSMGVHKVSSHSQWNNVVEQLKSEVREFASNFPEAVLSSSSFIVEEILKGDEFAVDAYYDKDGKPVILNIFQHPFVSEDDVSDRAYITSKEIIEANHDEFQKVLENIGKALNMRNFPIHIELIKGKEIVPVEINPMRFAGWCTTDAAYFAYGINIYEYFENNLKPDWSKIEGGKIYYFAMAETPQNVDKSKIVFDYDALEKSFSKILDFRKINYLEKPLFAVIFGEAQDMNEINRILQLDMKDFISTRLCEQEPSQVLF